MWLSLEGLIAKIIDNELDGKDYKYEIQTNTVTDLTNAIQVTVLNELWRPIVRTPTIGTWSKVSPIKTSSIVDTYWVDWPTNYSRIYTSRRLSGAEVLKLLKDHPMVEVRSPASLSEGDLI